RSVAPLTACWSWVSEKETLLRDGCPTPLLPSSRPVARQNRYKRRSSPLRPPHEALRRFPATLHEPCFPSAGWPPCFPSCASCQIVVTICRIFATLIIYR